MNEVTEKGDKKAKLKPKIKKVKKPIKTGPLQVAAVETPAHKKSKIKKAEKQIEAETLQVASVETPAQQAIVDDKIKSAKPEKSKKKFVLQLQSNATSKSHPKKIKSLEDSKEAIDKKGTPEQTVFVGNLPISSKPMQIKKIFAPFGKVLSIRIRTANGKEICKNNLRKDATALIAFVVLHTPEAAAKALELNGTVFKNQHLRVTELRTAATQQNKQSVSKTTVFVGNLQFSATDEKLHQIFSSCGEIEYVRTLQGGFKKGCNGVAYVCFKSADAVGLALELNGTMLDERPIRVERYSVKKLGARAKRGAEAEALQTNSKKKSIPEKKFKSMKHPSRKYEQKISSSEDKIDAIGSKDAEKKEKTTSAPASKDRFKEKMLKIGGNYLKKKSEFRGVRSETIKKKPKKKFPSKQNWLASKIAPRDKTAA